MTAPPPFGDVATKTLIVVLVAAHEGIPVPDHLRLDRRGATPDDVRRELRRRSAVGHA